MQWSCRASGLRARGFSLIEALITLAVLLVLLFAVSSAVTHTLRVAALSSGRASAARTMSELATRLSEEARSSTAVFIPASDVLGAANDGAAAHEVDFFRRLSAGGDAFVAYRFDAPSGAVTRYEYTLGGGGATIVHADDVAAGLTSFGPVRAPAGSMGDVVGAASVSDVSILYGRPGVVGGNDVVTVTMQGAVADGIAPAPVSVHLGSRAAPTSLSLLTPAAPPPAPPGPPITIPFIIHSKGGPFRAPHGPWHFADPGSNGGAESTGVRGGGVGGVVQYIGPGVGWLELFAAYPEVESGTYTYTDASGSRITVVISCGPVPCPIFRPLPSSGSAPSGGVSFDAVP